MNFLFANSQVKRGSWRSFVGSVLGQRIRLPAQGRPPILGLMFSKSALVKMKTEDVEQGFGLAAVGLDGAHLELQADVFGAVATDGVGAFVSCHSVPHKVDMVEFRFTHERAA